MHRISLVTASLLLGSIYAGAQTVASFEDLSLAHPDTFYVNYSASMSDVGYNDGLAHFPCYYDTSWGGFWSSGFAYSNMTDSATSGFLNQYSARAGRGYDTSHNYVVAYGNQNYVKLIGAAAGNPVYGCYVTNSTYAANIMRDGDPFARKFHNGDWFKLTVHGFLGGVMNPDSVTFYLANYLFPDSTMNYIVKSWQWVNLVPLGHVDSLQFSLSSSDNGLYGMNTPAYFCLDNFTTAESSTLKTACTPQNSAARVYPNPAIGELYVDLFDQSLTRAIVMDMSGRTIESYDITSARLSINTATLQAGAYIMRLTGNGKNADMRFIKQ